MNRYDQTISYTKAILTYLITVSSVLAIKSTGSWLNGLGESKKLITKSLKRNSLESTLPLIEAIEIGRFNFTNTIEDIIVKNNTLYMAAGTSGVHIVDVKNITSPTVFGNYSIEGFAHQLQLKNNEMYIAYDWRGLKIVDVSNFNNITAVGSYIMGKLPDRGSVTKLKLINNKMLLVDENVNQFDIVDVSQPRDVFRAYTEIDYSVSGPYLACALDNGFLYISSDYSGITVFDVKNPDDPRLLTHYPLDAFVQSLNVRNGMVYAANYNIFLTINFTDPFNPQQLSTYTTLGDILDINLQNNIAYLACRTSGLRLLNITTSQPRLMGSYDTPGYATKLSTVDGISYLADAAGGLQIINVKNATGLQLLGSYNLKTAVGIEVQNNVTYVADDQMGLCVFNTSDPRNPRLLWSNQTRYAYDVFINGNSLFLTEGSYQPTVFRKFDISDPTSPKLEKSIGSGTFNNIIDVTIANDLLYIVDESYSMLYILNRNNPLSNSLIFQETKQIIDLYAEDNFLLYTIQSLGLVMVDSTQLNIGWRAYQFIKQITSIELSQNKLYLAEASGGLQILDTSDPSNLAIICSYNASWQFPIIKLFNNHLYLASRGIFQAFNLNNGNDPVPISSLIDTYTSFFDIHDHYAYVANNTQLQIIDITDPSIMKVVGQYNETGIINAISVSADYVLLNRNIKGYGTQILDITNPIDPLSVGNYKRIANPRKILSLKTIGFILDYGFLDIIDVNDPANIQLLGYQMGSGSGDLALKGDILYISGESLLVLEIADLTNPILLRGYDTPEYTPLIKAQDSYIFYIDLFGGLQIINLVFGENQFTPEFTASQVTAFNKMVYLADNGKNIHVLNISNINSPTELFRFQLGNYALEMIADDKYLYVAEGFNGVEIFDVSNLTAPVFAARITEGLNNVKNIRVENNTLYVVDNNKEIVIFDLRKLVYLLNKINIYENEKHLINLNDVTVTGFTNVMASQLQISVKDIAHGHFEVMAQQGLPIINFTLAQVQANQIIFEHDGSEAAPSFSLQFSDGIITKGPLTADIVFHPINDPPVLLNYLFAINEGESMSINDSHLNATDIETNPQDLVFIITQQGHSQFERISNPKIITTQFTQKEVMNGEILFRHISQQNNNDLTPYFLVAVSDGTAESNSVEAIIDYNAAPRLSHNQFTVSRGQKLVLSSKELAATDRDDATETLIFIVSNTTHGSFNQYNFTQKNVTAGIIEFQHDNSNEAPSFEISVKDKRMQTSAQPAVVTFSNKNSDLLLDELGIGLTAAGGGVGLALVAGGIFAYRNYARNKNSRKQDPFAAAIYKVLKPIGAADFNSAQGQRFVQGLLALKRELKNQNIDIDNMGVWELNQFAEQTTLAIQSEITHDTNWRGESIVDGHDLQRYASRLATAIQKIRAGVYETSTSLGI